MSISEKDEYAHTPSSHPLWRESHYFNFYDPNQNIGGFTTIAVMPNKGLVETGMVLVRDNMLIYANPYEGALKGRWDDLNFGGLSYEVIKPMDIWKIRLEDEELELELTFKSINPAFDYGDDLGELEELVGTRHYEHSGTVRGTINLGDQRINFSGLGERDHSWGIRNWHGCRRWVWLSVQFGQNLALNCWYADVSGRKHVRGFVYNGKENSSVSSIDIRNEFEDDGKTQKEMSFKITDSRNRIFSIEAEALIVIPVLKVSPNLTTLINEGFTRFRCGDKTGFGITEYLWTDRCL
ncbi:MAG: hypothetical protein JSW28_09240 [Thermoplasmata archaeon]|nr:MAG: hypothetical protein JSW28_09240 [Thermoplasmata archaeon]